MKSWFVKLVVLGGWIIGELDEIMIYLLFLENLMQNREEDEVMFIKNVQLTSLQ